MNYRLSPLVSICLALSPWVPSGGLDANESESAAVQTLAGPASDGAPKSPTHTVTRELIKIEVVLQGVIEAENMATVTIEPEAWTQLKVVEAVDHGTRVRQGETLVTLETDQLEEAIEELESAHRLSELSLEQKRVDLRHVTKTLPMEVRSAELSRKQAREDLDYFLKVGRAETEKNVEFHVKRSRNYLEYQKEELLQLEKMYGADDLTEETEEIVLKRQRDSVEMAIFSLERAKISRDQRLAMNLPRREEEARNRAARQDLTWDKAKLTLPMVLEKKRLELAGLEHKLEKTAERLEELRRDRGVMTIVAPADGFVYYGQFVRGNWSGSSVMAKRLSKGGLVPAGEVLMTIVVPRPFVLRATVPEKELGHVNAGARGTATPTAYSEVELPAKIRSLSEVPIGPGSFEALIELEAVDPSPRLLPGMTCAVKFIPYEEPDALTVPERAVFSEETGDSAAEQRKFVFVALESGEHEKRIVKTGKTVGGKTVILEGLTEGTRVLLERPRGE